MNPIHSRETSRIFQFGAEIFESDFLDVIFGLLKLL